MRNSNYDTVDVLSANVIRGLAVDAIEAAGGGHPGMPLGMADAATVLWTRFLRHNPTNPKWPDRDRYVQSAGHGAMLLYSLLHLSGYDLPLEQLRRHRRLHSLTPGHPEYGRTPGVETTTGPLGQGFASGVGMALAEAHLSARFNRPGYTVVDHFTYGIVGDGDLQEGIAHEAASLAGHLGLAKLIYLFDDNRMTIDGPTSVSQSEDTLQRFDAYGWHVQAVDGHDMRAIDAAIRLAQAVTDRPSLIACRTIIGFGSPNKQNTPQAHSSALGEEEATLTKRALNLPVDETFWIPDEVRYRWLEAREAGRKLEDDWHLRMRRYARAFPDLAQEFREAMAGHLPDRWDEALPEWDPGVSLSPRLAATAVLEAVAGRVKSLVGGSADLTVVGAHPKSAVPIQKGDFGGTWLHYGIREHAMAGIMTGMALHGGVIPYSTTFLVFSDYSRGAVRVGALMNAPVIHVWTHDSVAVGEDGPTHQPVEQLASLRCVPNLVVVRPADANETAAAWRLALTRRNGPVALILARQDLPVVAGTREKARRGVAAGAYVLADPPSGQPDVILLSTGSEVAVAMAARDLLAARGKHARVVSMPS